MGINTQTIQQGRIEPTTGLPTKVIRALWMLWKIPEQEAHAGTLERINDPLVTRAAETIQGGAAALSAVARGADYPLQHLLDLVTAYPAPQAYRDILTRPKRLTDDGRPLAAELWPGREPAMVADVEEGPLSGKWPAKPSHICQNGWRAEETGEGEFIVNHWTGRAWRGQECPACYYDRVFRTCRQLEWEFTQNGLDSFRWQLLPAGNYKRLVDNIRTHRRRSEVDIRYVALPQHNTYFVVHNDTHQVGEPMPARREELFDLVAKYADTFDERLLSHSNGWGGPWAGVKGNGRPAAQEEDEQPRKSKEERIVIAGLGIADLLSFVEGMGYHVKQTGSRFKLGISAEQLIELLELRGRKYFILQGKGRAATYKEAVTDQGHINNTLGDMSQTRVKIPDRTPQMPLIPAGSQPDPAPIYL